MDFRLPELIAFDLPSRSDDPNHYWEAFAKKWLEHFIEWKRNYFHTSPPWVHMIAQITKESSLSTIAEQWGHLLSIECMLRADDHLHELTIELRVGTFYPVLYTLKFDINAHSRDLEISGATQEKLYEEELAGNDDAMISQSLVSAPWQMVRNSQSNHDPILEECLEGAMSSLSDCFGGHTQDCFGQPLCHRRCLQRREPHQHHLYNYTLAFDVDEELAAHVQFLPPMDMFIDELHDSSDKDQ